MFRITGLGCGLLLLMEWAIGCRSEQVAFKSPAVALAVTTKQLPPEPNQPSCQRTDAVVEMALAPIAIKRSGVTKAVRPAGKNRHKTPPQRPQLLSRTFVKKPLSHPSATATPAGTASSGWKGFGEFMLLISLPLAMFGALAGAIFNVSFWAGLAYVALGFTALVVLTLLAAVGYQLYKAVAAPHAK